MKYARHFVITFLFFIAIILAALFFNYQPFKLPSSPVVSRYIPPFSIDVCQQTIPQSSNGQYQSVICDNSVNHDANYYYYGTVNSGYGTYLPYTQ